MMKLGVVFCVCFVGVVTVVLSQVADRPDGAAPFQHLLTKELGRMAKNIRKQLHSEMTDLVQELRQEFLQTTIYFESISENTSVEIYESMTKEKDILEDRFMKVVNYSNHRMEELTNYLQYLQRAVKGDVDPYGLHDLLVTEASVPQRISEVPVPQSVSGAPVPQRVSEAPVAHRVSESPVTQKITTHSTDTYLSVHNSILLSTEESSSYFDNTGSTSNAAAAMRPDALTMTVSNISRPRSCYEVYQNGNTQDGIYIISPEGPGGIGIAVWCVMSMDGGGWTVVLGRRHAVEHVEFDRPIHDYIIGFGQPKGHYWMGLRHLENLCEHQAQKLKVYMQDWDGNNATADYDNFSIAKSNDSWILQVSGYQTASTAGDALTSQNGAMFTYIPELGAWWHSNEGGATPTGKYYTQGTADPQGKEAGVAWPTWKGTQTSLKSLLIMIRPNN